LMSSIVGIFVIPGLYVIFQTAREKIKALHTPKAPAEAPKTDQPDHAA